MHWRRKWQPAPVFLPGESQGWGSLVDCHYGVTQSRTRLKRLSNSSSSSTSLGTSDLSCAIWKNIHLQVFLNLQAVLFHYCCCSFQVEVWVAWRWFPSHGLDSVNCRQPVLSSRAPCALHFLQVGGRSDQTETVGAVVSSGRHTWLVGPLFLRFSAQTR